MDSAAILATQKFKVKKMLTNFWATKFPPSVQNLWLGLRSINRVFGADRRVQRSPGGER